MLLAGYAREQVGCRDIVAKPLDVGVKPAGVRHTDHFWPHGVRALRIVLSSSVIAEMGELSQITERWDWITGSEAVRPLLRTASLLRQANRNKTDLEEDFYDAFAALLPEMPARITADAPSWLLQARDHLETSYASGIRLTHLAKEADVHPVYFARQFRRFFGRNISSYVRKLKTRTTVHLLASQPYSLAQIASETGFSDQAHMTRDLRERVWSYSGAISSLGEVTKMNWIAEVQIIQYPPDLSGLSSLQRRKRNIGSKK